MASNDFTIVAKEGDRTSLVTESTPYVTVQEAIALANNPQLSELKKWADEAYFGTMSSILPSALKALRISTQICVIKELAKLASESEAHPIDLSLNSITRQDKQQLQYAQTSDVYFKGFDSGEIVEYTGHESHGQFLDSNKEWKPSISSSYLNKEEIKANMQEFIEAFTTENPTEDMPSFVRAINQELTLGIELQQNEQNLEQSYPQLPPPPE